MLRARVALIAVEEDEQDRLLRSERAQTVVSGNQATYGPGTIRLAEDAVINIKNRSFSLVAEIDNPTGDAQGTLVTLGGETGGYALLVVDGKPTFHYNFLGLQRYSITATERLPKDPSTIGFDFVYDGGGPGKGGTGTLTINGRAVGEGRIDRTVPVYFSSDDTVDVGEDWGTHRYHRPTNRRSSSPASFAGSRSRCRSGSTQDIAAQDTAEPEMAGGAVGGLRLPGGEAVAQAAARHRAVRSTAARPARGRRCSPGRGRG
ncbi:hypothetical protein [Kitasatospora sp. NPDC085879]|uniref:hypothetical protein n=1 Tax=Kitasatospora sp. NPDC085879 TaxID=3154769 RepID=UPI0034197D5F